MFDSDFLGTYAGLQEDDRMRFEDATDPERRAAIDFGHTTQGDRGWCHSWFLEDQQQAVNIVERNDGTWLASIEDFTESFR